MSGAILSRNTAEAYDELGLGSYNRTSLVDQLAEKLSQTVGNMYGTIDPALILDTVVGTLEQHRAKLKSLTGKISQEVFTQMRAQNLFSPEARCSLALFGGATKQAAKYGIPVSDPDHRSSMAAAVVCDTYFTQRATMTSFDPCLLQHHVTGRDYDTQQKLMRGMCELVATGFVYEKTGAFASAYMPAQRHAKPASAVAQALKA